MRSDVGLNLKDDTFARLVAAGGLHILLTMEVPPGTYIARGALQDGLEGKLVTVGNYGFHKAAAVHRASPIDQAPSSSSSLFFSGSPPP